MSYAQRITWLRARLKSEVETQRTEKTNLKQPHDSLTNAGHLQAKTISRRYDITALHQLLTEERNKVRPADKRKPYAHDYDPANTWAISQTEYARQNLLKELDVEHPYPKLYVVVDSKLSAMQKGIQAAHAMTELYRRHGVPDHSALVFLQADQLYPVIGQLQKQKFVYARFEEPYWGNKLTAIAVLPLESEDLETLMQQYELAGPPAVPVKVAEPQSRLARLKQAVIGS